MKGAWLLPTRRRTGQLARFFKAALETKQSTPGIVLYSDPADIYNVDIPPQWSVHRTQAEGVGDKFRETWPIYKDLDWVGWLVDDVIPQTEGWDRTLISGLNGTNCISCNDGARAPFRMHCPVYSGDLLRAIGYLYAPGFWHSWMDDALERLGRATDTWWVCMDVTLKHDDQFQSGVWDETGKKAYSRSAEDKAAFMRWRVEEMDAAVRRVMALKAERAALAPKQPYQRKVANA